MVPELARRSRVSVLMNVIPDDVGSIGQGPPEGSDLGDSGDSEGRRLEESVDRGEVGNKTRCSRVTLVDTTDLFLGEVASGSERRTLAWQRYRYDLFRGSEEA